jgi:undecaprenyl-diphosphatase
VVLSIVLARSLADLLQIRPRPMYEPGFRPLLFHRMADFEDWSSFPSDNAAVLFSLTTGFWLVSRGWGLLWACFSVIAVTARIYTGIHYPGDVLAGALVGIGAAFAANNAFTRTHVAAPVIAVERRAPGFFYCLLFLFIFEASTMFTLTRSLRRAIMHVLFGLGS